MTMNTSILITLAMVAVLATAQTNSLSPVPFAVRDLPHAVRYETKLDSAQLEAFRSLLRPAVQLPEIPPGATLRIWVRPEPSGAAVVIEIPRN